MEWLFVGIGAIVLVALGWFLHRRFGAEPVQTHTNVKPLKTHEGDSLLAQGVEGRSMGN